MNADARSAANDTKAAIWVRLAVAYLLVQGLGGLAWWVMLLSWPASRGWFLPTGAPDVALLAFAAADLVLYVGGSLAAACGLALQRAWAWPALCLHCGAAVYAALYCIGLWLLDRNVWLPAAMMAPSLVLVPLFTWQLRPCGRPSQ